MLYEVTFIVARASLLLTSISEKIPLINRAKADCYECKNPTGALRGISRIESVLLRMGKAFMKHLQRTVI